MMISVRMAVTRTKTLVLSSSNLVQLCVDNVVGNELPLLRDLNLIHAA